ncbi:DUF3119 family protein [Aphanothece sacrum]|uniref:Glycerol dehydrogenase n=1 Tax=Aphanothece sacrum FPU1 TaxID=1920663 RepID=A0A401IH99_APHSA|nr:DUF3119 family protein [Aphanothece sacrum]GBF80675.1 hypothetical protein AsFPU1_2079 [Aphanothece sacrum FPU1]GBF83169.1 hypothetical protein AsFPU3_0208 [Aphanothece sacrum FPU3]
MTSINSSAVTPKTVELAPKYNIPLVLIGIAIALLFIQPWLSLPLALFGLFLLIQTVTIRLQFTPTALDVYRSNKLLRHFPYSEWQNWEIFWYPVPILFYFKEVNSIHFLPIIFDAKTLKICLEEHYPLVK